MTANNSSDALCSESLYSEETLNLALKLGSSTLHEASGLKDSAADPAIRPVWSGAAVAGPAYPLECAPGDNLAIHVAMELVPEGSVLVVSADGFLAGYWGEVLTVAAEAAGVKGLIIDGGVRDIDALERRQFPAFSRGITMTGTHKACVPSVGQPIRFAGTPVKAGDLVVADTDGVLIVPQEHVESCMIKSQQRADKEDTMMLQLTQGRSSLELMGLSSWSQKA